MDIQFVATVAVIAPDPVRSRGLYVDALGYRSQARVTGTFTAIRSPVCKSFGIWPLSQAARACFGVDQWPTARVVPQVSIEFDVPSAEAVAAAARDLIEAGHELLHGAREVPWGQTVARVQSPEGAIDGIAYAPVLHR